MDYLTLDTGDLPTDGMSRICWAKLMLPVALDFPLHYPNGVVDIRLAASADPPQVRHHRRLPFLENSS